MRKILQDCDYTKVCFKRRFVPKLNNKAYVFTSGGKVWYLIRF